MLAIDPGLKLIARGGGGGSGGGGGGAGIILIGYLPTHFVGAVMRRKLKNPTGLTLTVMATLIYTVLWFVLGGFWFIVGLAALVGGPAGYFDWFGKVSAKVRKKAQQDIAKAAAIDPAWNQEALSKHVSETFARFQADWSNFNLASITTYLTPDYARHISLMLAAIKLRQRRNQVDEPTIIELLPVEINDLPGNTHDRVTYFIHAKAKDKLIENIDGQEKLLFEDKNQFYEYWRFVRIGNNWLLDNISQQTENRLMLNKGIETFAKNNSLYYSPDWGWLLLPRRGQLFKGGKFGRSDVNNHVIGMYRNLLIELYTYVPATTGNTMAQYTIAQVALPKRYDSLIVQARQGILKSYLARTPKGYNKIKLEWPDFNKRYIVYATSVEQVTAFELLHPVYMEKLFALKFKVSIEVVDNVVYLYSLDKKADYSTMYSILQDAFKEMRL